MSRGDGRLYITYNEMGQGDNILICCPNGKVIVIDCGAARWDGNYFEPPAKPAQLRQRAIEVMFESRFLQNNQTIDALILTHADKDHCNELPSIFHHTLSGTPKVSAIEACYHSGSIWNYSEGGTAWFLTHTLIPANTYAITINNAEKKLDNVPIPNSPANTAEINKISAIPATSGFVKIIDGTHNKPGAQPCNVYILASNVVRYQIPPFNARPPKYLEDGYGDTEEAVRNRSSVVTMVIYGDKKFLFVGDATFNTEKFLKDTYGQKIQNLELLHVGHHASYRTSSSYRNDTGDQTDNVKAIDFISHVNPKYLAISAAYDSGKLLKLPRWETINNYIHGASRLVQNAGNNIHCNWNVLAQFSNAQGKRRLITEGYSEIGMKTTDRYILCTGTHGVLDFHYKEVHDRNTGTTTVRAFKIKENGDEELLP